MATTDCTVPDCPRPARARAAGHHLCWTHYKRWQRHGDPLYEPPTDLERLLAHVEQRPGDQCWPWTAGLTDDGYGKFSFTHNGRHKAMTASRALWLLTFGEPNGQVLHDCGNRPCCRLDHLYDGTHAQNMTDRTRHGRTGIGSRNGNAKLSDIEVRSIRMLYASGSFTQRELAALYGISRAMTSFIVTRRYWSHLD
jgi:hypothetical protein